MTVQFLRSYNSFNPGQILTFDSATEASLIQQNIAATVAGGPTYAGLTIQVPTWTSRPSASNMAGSTILVTDIGPSPGTRFTSDGTNWIVSGAHVIGRQNTQVVAPLDTNENTLYSLNIPAALLALNGSLRVSVDFSTVNNANNKTIAVRFGGIVMGNVINGAAGNNAAIFLCIANRNSAVNQRTRNVTTIGSTGVANVSTVNTLIDQLLIVTVTKAVGSDAAALESVLVELMP